jgi:hypothetical protein
LLSFGAHEAKLLLEFYSPDSQRSSFIIKDDSISSFPNHPAGSDEDFSENVATKVCSSLNDHIQRLKIQIPLNLNGALAIGTERAVKEKMIASFFQIIIAKKTGIVLKEHIFSP